MSIDESTPMVHGVEPDESRRPRGNKKVFGHLFRKAKIVRRINKKGTYEQEQGIPSTTAHPDETETQDFQNLNDDPAKQSQQAQTPPTWLAECLVREGVDEGVDKEIVKDSEQTLVKDGIATEQDFVPAAPAYFDTTYLNKIGIAKKDAQTCLIKLHQKLLTQHKHIPAPPNLASPEPSEQHAVQSVQHPAPSPQSPQSQPQADQQNTIDALTAEVAALQQYLMSIGAMDPALSSSSSSSSTGGPAVSGDHLHPSEVDNKHDVVCELTTNDPVEVYSGDGDDNLNDPVFVSAADPQWDQVLLKDSIGAEDNSLDPVYISSTAGCGFVDNLKADDIILRLSLPK